MSSTDQPATMPSRDGTSQAGRLLPELDPDYARVDERTTRDLLAFAREYAHELKYFGPTDPDTPQGDWSGFIGPDVDVDDAADYASAPETFSAERAAPYTRPHFALFLAFLELFDQTRRQLNALTRRHLEFFYRDVLQMVRKRAVPDAVHVLVDLESGTDELALPAGTALRAGKDSLGRELTYRTDRELIANQVQVARISSLHVEMKITGIREASRQYIHDGTRNDSFVAMLRIALGQPNPGDPLPVNLTATPPLYPGVPPTGQTNPTVGFDALVQAQKLVAVVADGLGMPSFDDFRSLMRLKQLRQDNEAKDWTSINSALEAAGKRRLPTFKINPQSATDFNGNVTAALGRPVDHLFDGLAEVASMEEAYAAYVNRPREVEAFLTLNLAPLTVSEFASMMAIKVLMDAQWAEINRLLGEAAKRKAPSFTTPPDARALRNVDQKLPAFGLNLKSGTDFAFVGNLDQYFDAFSSVERYFYMSAENFTYLMSVAPPATADDWTWDKVYEIVAAAHSEMIYARRRDALLSVARPGGAPIADPVEALRALVAVVLDEDISVDELPQKLVFPLMADKDLAYLQDITAKRQTAPDWSRVVKVLEIAQRNRENFQVPVAEKVEWRNLYPAADATAVTAQSAQADVEAVPRWKTFGQGEQPRDQIPVPPAVFGWAMASPLLALSEGARTITLTLGFSPDPTTFDVDKIRTLLAPLGNAPTFATFNPFQVQVSTAKGWLEPDSVAISWVNPNMLGYPAVAGADTSKLHKLTFQFTIAKGLPELTPLTREVHGIDTTNPVLRLMMKPVWNAQDKCYLSSYQVLRQPVLMRARLDVFAQGLTKLQIHNDQNTLDAKKPFEPFGLSPAAGSRLYIGHPELVAKKLDAVGFNITWMGAPANLATTYTNYPGGLGNASFKARVALSDEGVLKDFTPALTLFDTTNATNVVSVTVKPPTDQGNPDNAITDSADVTEWNRYLLWELNTPDFQHAVYPNLAMQKSFEMAAAVANAVTSTATPKPTVVAASYQVSAPYTPKIKSLTIDYTAFVELALDPLATAAPAARVFHVQPFGYDEMIPEGVLPGCVFLPQYDFEGELYIGLRNVTAPQNVSLLLQVAEGSANPDFAPDPVQWSYLSGDRWLTLQDGGLLADATRGLINSGIVELSLKPAEPSTLLPDGLYWIRAAIARSADGVCDMVSIHPNAAVATFADNDNAPDHLSSPLPAESIAGPVAPMAGVSRIRQPYTSFGGKLAEQDTSFYVRVSERLRHKERALTPWDYERLVLEKFPRLYKVKCLRADMLAHPRDPGLIELVVIPDIRNRLPFNPFEPKAPADLIRDVEAFLQDKILPFASVKVKNAHYVPVKVRCGVRFVAGADPGFCRRLLNEELNRFLSPWAYEDGADLVIGGSIYANSIINFIDRREYVDYVAEFKLFTSEDGETVKLIPPSDDYHASTDTPDGVLVAARQHEFDVISEADYRAEDFTGINYMRIELDFIVG